MTITNALDRAIDSLVGMQTDAGRWPANNDGGVPPTVSTALTELCLGILSKSDAQAYCQYLDSQQRTDGGFSAFPYAHSSSFAATALAWAFLHSQNLESSSTIAARKWLDNNGGLEKADLPTQIWMAIAGAIDPTRMEAQPLFAPLIPGLAGSLGKRMSYMTVFGLFVTPAMIAGLRDGNKTFHRIWRPIRFLVRLRLKRYLRKHQNPAGNWLGAQPFTVLALCTLKLMGESNDRAPMQAGIQYLNHWKCHTIKGLHALPFTAETWNTALITRLLLQADPEKHSNNIQKGLSYLLSEQSKLHAPKDWLNAPPSMPRTGAWAYEADNPLACDVDSTGCILASIVMAKQAGFCTGDSNLEAPKQWVLGMQNVCGGWPAFTHGLADKSPAPMFTQPLPTPSNPIAALKMMLKPPVELGDPATADLTGRVLEALSILGEDRNGLVISKAIEFIKSMRTEKGIWWGRWELNYVLATTYVLTGLNAVGLDHQTDWFKTAFDWVLDQQNNDGGWGETAESYTDPKLAGIGPSSPNITGSVLCMMLQVKGAASPAARKGVDYLLAKQRDDGLWDETVAVGVLQPPEGFYTNTVYSQYSPVKALLDFDRMSENNE